MILFRSLAGALVLACILVSSQAAAQSALEWASQGMSYTKSAGPYKSSREIVTTRFARRLFRAEGRLASVYAPLAVKAQEIASSCGSRVVSGVRHTRVAGSRRWSLHASGHAVDMAGNPACIYAHLRDWPGGYSTDYRRVYHVHISLGGREDGVRFAHRGGRTHIAWR